MNLNSCIDSLNQHLHLSLQRVIIELNDVDKKMVYYNNTLSLFLMNVDHTDDVEDRGLPVDMVSTYGVFRATNFGSMSYLISDSLIQNYNRLHLK